MGNSTSILAQVQRGSTGLEDALNKFFASPIGGIVDSLLDVAALGLAGLGVWMVVKAAKSSNPGAEILKKGLWPFVAATLVLQLNWTTALIGYIQKGIEAIIDSVGSLIPGLG